ncbi:MAG: tRNA pseudouridine(13) synthase TruD [Planctomycetota bacterium]
MRGEDLGALPRRLDDALGLGGAHKSTPEDFAVEELPAYEASGGAHLHLVLRRAGRNTHDLARELAALLGAREDEVGYAGRKDRHAVTTQAFTVHAPDLEPDEAASRVAAELGVEVLAASRHGNKLRLGHLRGNRFTLRIRGARAGAADLSRAALERLAAEGAPNYFGAQRFGRGGDNVARGLAILRGRRAPRRERDLMVSALQAALFNDWLARRSEDGLLDVLLEGDLARTARGGLFDVEDAAVEAPRLAAGEIEITGPIFGAKMRAAGGAAGLREAAVLANHGLAPADFRPVRAEGSRRPALLRPREVAVTTRDGDPVLSFVLPKGAYATVLLRELGVENDASLRREED